MPSIARLVERLESLPGRAALFLGLLLLAACGGGGGSTGTGGGTGGGSVTLVSIALTPSNPTTIMGSTLQFTAIGTYSDGSTRDLSASTGWSTSAPQVATVTASGLATAVGAGTTMIGATTAGVTASTTLTVSPGQATVTFFFSFGAPPMDGAQPSGPLLQAGDGNFYGTTSTGGPNSCQGVPRFCGTVYRLTPGGQATILYGFGASATDGNWPMGPLIQGSDGALYGTTAFGGAHGVGTLFRITLGGAYSVLYSFGASPSDGSVPNGGLVQAADGNFYGTTSNGGANHCANIPQNGGNCGTVFRITPAGAETILYSFGSSPADGVEPTGHLIQAIDGNFYGTTLDGGANSCSTTGLPNSCGTVYRITPAGAVTILHSFGSSLADGIAPQGPLIQGRDGALYGTTASGGGGTCGFQFGCGTVFRITPVGDFTVLYAFARTGGRSDGHGPAPFLIQAIDGNFYGTTRSGGAVPSDSTGTAFRLTPAGAKTILYSFGPLNTNPSDPAFGLIQGNDGAFYGLTVGTAFRLVPP